MYRVPSSLQRSKKETTKLNLIPILDSVFIFIFFLLVSANFVNLKELASDIPILADAKPSDTKPLALTVRISGTKISFYRDLESNFIKSFNIADLKEQTNKEQVKTLLADLKKAHQKEKTIVLEPEESVDYNTIIKVMDILNMNQSKENKTPFFGNLVFGNITESN